MGNWFGHGLGQGKVEPCSFTHCRMAPQFSSQLLHQMICQTQADTHARLFVRIDALLNLFSQRCGNDQIQRIFGQQLLVVALKDDGQIPFGGILRHFQSGTRVTDRKGQTTTTLVSNFQLDHALLCGKDGVVQEMSQEAA